MTTPKLSRLMAHFSEDPNMIEAFLERCRYSHHAATQDSHYIPPEEVTSDLRRKAKTANFGINYGITPFGLRNRLGIPLGEAQQLVNGYFATYPSVRTVWIRLFRMQEEKAIPRRSLAGEDTSPDLNNATIMSEAMPNG